MSNIFSTVWMYLETTNTEYSTYGQRLFGFLASLRASLRALARSSVEWSATVFMLALAE